MGTEARPAARLATRLARTGLDHSRSQLDVDLDGKHVARVESRTRLVDDRKHDSRSGRTGEKRLSRAGFARMRRLLVAWLYDACHWLLAAAYELRPVCGFRLSAMP